LLAGVEQREVEGPRRNSTPPQHSGPFFHRIVFSSGWRHRPHPDSAAWPILMSKLVTVLADYAAQQVAAGADVIQVFDSWAGALSPTDYRQYVLAPTNRSHPPHPAPSASRSSTSAWTPHRSSPPCERPPPMSSASTGAPRSIRPGALSTTAVAVQGQPRSYRPLRSTRGPPRPRRRGPGRRRRPPRTHLQPRPRHRPLDPVDAVLAGREPDQELGAGIELSDRVAGGRPINLPDC